MNMYSQSNEIAFSLLLGIYKTDFVCGTWFGLSIKGRRNFRQYDTKKLPPMFVENYYRVLITNAGARLLRQEKIASRKVSSFAS